MKKTMGTKWMVAAFAAWPVMAGANAGTVGAEFLRMGAGARGMSMGEGFSALVDDATALYWNPAALATLEQKSATLMHAKTIEDSFMTSGAMVRSWGWGALGWGSSIIRRGRWTLRILGETRPGPRRQTTWRCWRGMGGISGRIRWG
ncbi:MAG: UPF0164 family protein [Elusimicrobia bacterium]|nr:UPF0164 family protein [Elusimicrobiota bacterium]